MSRSYLSHAVCLKSPLVTKDSGDGAHHIAVHEEGNRLTESSTHEGNLKALAVWIVTTHGRARTEEMLGTYTARDRTATELLGRYYPSLPTFVKLVDALGSATSTNEMRMSVLREALHIIELTGVKKMIRVATTAEQPVISLEEVAA